MRKWLSILLFCGLVPGTAAAQVVVQFGAPAIRWETRPPRVYVAPGMWVVGDSDDEVFYQGGWYWAHSHDRWYRSHGRRGGWVVVEDRHVPGPLLRYPPGQYRRYHAPEHARTMVPPGWGRRAERAEYRHEERHQEGREEHREMHPAAQPQGSRGPGHGAAPAPRREHDRGNGGRGQPQGGHGNGRGNGHGHER